MSRAEELAKALENLEATGWGGDCFALTEYSEKQAELAAAELRRLASELAECKAAYESQFKELHALKASIGEPVAWQKRRLLRSDDNWTMVSAKNLQPYRDSPDFAVRPLYAIKDNQP